LFLVTAPIPVHPVAQTAEQYFISELTRAGAIIDRLTQSSQDVIRLVRGLMEDITDHDRTRIEDQLESEFEAALHQGAIPPGMVPGVSRLLAHNIVRSIRMVLTQKRNSLVVHFLCMTAKALYQFGQTMSSSVMLAVFTDVVESLSRRPTVVDAYVRPDEFNRNMSYLSSPQDKGVSSSLLLSLKSCSTNLLSTKCVIVMS